MNAEDLTRINHFLNRITQLKRGGREGGGKQPHKLFLLLAIADLIGEGLTNQNEIPVNNALKTLFEDYWQTYEPDTKIGDIAMPLRKLANDGIWELTKKTLHKSGVGFNRIKNESPYGWLAEDWFNFLSNPFYRHAFKSNIINYYFSSSYKAYTYTDPEEDPNLNRTAKRLIKGEKIEPEEIFLRNDAFQKLIKKYYDFTCCVTGARILANQYKLIEAAHIKDFAISHNDALDNGLAMNPLVHKAFDMGLLTIEKGKKVGNYTIKVSDKIQEGANPYFHLKDLHKQPLQKLPPFERYHPNAELLEWHQQQKFENFL
jgi:putative restriction endonuclease